MELKEYLKIIKKRSKLILAVGAITGVSAFLFSAMQPVKYETSLSLLVNKSKTQQTDDFKYDGYYALQAGEIITNSIEQWLKSPETVNAIYQKAGVDSNFESIKDYTKKFAAKKMSSQYVEVKFRTETREKAERLSQAIRGIINAKVEALEKNSEEEIAFTVEGGDPIIVEGKPVIFLNLTIGLVSGLVLGVFVVFAKEYFIS